MTEALHVRNISVQIDRNTILSNVSLVIPAQTIKIIIGPSGAGKSTLLKVMNGIISPKTGSVIIHGKNIRSKSRLNIRKKIGYIPQHLGLIESYSVLENVLMGSLGRINTLRSIFKFFPKAETLAARSLVNSFGLGKKMYAKVFHLSGGEKRRVAIARAFMQRPQILLADEILSDLDFVNVSEITKQLIQLTKKYGTTIVMVEHDLHIAKTFGDSIAILRSGKIVGNFKREELTDTLLNKYFRMKQ